MIQVEVNGAQRTVEPGTLEQLRAETLGGVPADHGICLLRVNGEEFGADHWDELELARVRSVVLRSAPRCEIARGALVETVEWIGRICGVLESIGADYRGGREEQAGARLADAADALHVLAHLLHGIHDNLQAGEAQAQARREARWQELERELAAGVDAAASDLSWRDPVALSDHLGFALPRTLRGFACLLEELAA
jgi:hypothetical protein